MQAIVAPAPRKQSKREKRVLPAVQRGKFTSPLLHVVRCIASPSFRSRLRSCKLPVFSHGWRLGARCNIFMVCACLEEALVIFWVFRPTTSTLSTCWCSGQVPSQYCRRKSSFLVRMRCCTPPARTRSLGIMTLTLAFSTEMGPTGDAKLEEGYGRF